MAYRTVAIPMTLSDLQGHAPIAVFSYNCAAFDKISTDIAHRAVFLR